MKLYLTARWRGDCGGKKQMWFPSNYVEEVDVANESENTSEMGNYRTGSIALTGVSVGWFGFTVFSNYANTERDGGESSPLFHIWSFQILHISSLLAMACLILC